MDLKVPEQLKDFYPLFTSCGPYEWENMKPPVFHFEVNDPTNRQKEETFFVWTESQVEVSNVFSYDDGETHCREDYVMTHENCLAYLAQLPRPWHVFTNEIIKHNKERAVK